MYILEVPNYLLQMSAAGNRFLIADKNWFEAASAPQSPGCGFPIDKSFEDFLSLAAFSDSKRKEFIADLLLKKEAALAEGLVVLRGQKNQALICDFYNKDGSKAEMCGNAVCCISFYIEKDGFHQEEGLPPIREIVLSGRRMGFSAGGVFLKSAPRFIKAFALKLDKNLFLEKAAEAPVDFEKRNEAPPPPKKENSAGGIDYFERKAKSGESASGAEARIEGGKASFKEQSLKIKPEMQLNIVIAGPPHGVIELPRDSLFDFKDKNYFRRIAQSLPARLRRRRWGESTGMNVSFFKEERPGFLKAITYERGVEDCTLACGTGALAAAFVYRRLRLQAAGLEGPAGSEGLFQIRLKKIKSFFKAFSLEKPAAEFKAGKAPPLPDFLRSIAVDMPGGRLKVQFEPRLFLSSPARHGWDSDS